MVWRLLLRVLSLAAKFGLTIVLARTLGLGAVADYGLAVAASVIASKLCGLGFGAELNRRLSEADPRAAIATARALRRVYGMLHASALCGAMTASLCGWLPGAASDPRTLGLLLLVAASEHYAMEVNAYVFSVHRARAGSSMLFVRTGGWAVFAIAGLLTGALDDVRAVFVLWTVMNLAVILWGWALLSRQAPDGRMQPGAARPAAALRPVWSAGVPFHVGGVLLAGLQYAERLIASALLPAGEVGRYVFLWSVANAVQTIAFASVGVIAGPRLARAADGSQETWRATLRASLRSNAAVSVAVALGIGCTAPLIFRMANERATAFACLTLAVLLVSFLLRSTGDVLWAACIARSRGRRIVVALCCAALVSLPLSFWLIGGDGAGQGGVRIALAHLLASTTALIALGWAQRGQPAGARADA